MATPKTRATGASVPAFLKAVPDEGRRRDCATVARLMKKVTGQGPRMWGATIVGFGSYRYRAAGGEATWPLTGFSPRKQDLTLYVMPGFERYQPLLKKLGPHKTGKSCLYLKSLAGVDLTVLETLLERSVADMRRAYPD